MTAWGAEEIWWVGFRQSQLRLMSYLSGLVEVLDVYWQNQEGILVLIVKNLDKSGILFRTGSIRARPVARYRPRKGPPQARSRT